jgi:SulP family sulfate permease
MPCAWPRSPGAGGEGASRFHPLLLAVLPFLAWLPRLSKAAVRADFLAGLTGAVIVLPQGVAFAAIAGLPPEYGLYAAIVPAIVAALFGSSWHLISGPTTAISLVVFANVSTLAEPGSMEYIRLALTLTLVSGVIQFGLGLARLGAIVNFVSHSVVVGFTAGASILIVTSQLGHFFGLSLSRGGNFMDTWIEISHQLGGVNSAVLAVSATTLVCAVLLRKFFPRWPGLLIAMIIGGLVAQLAGGSAGGIRFVGALPDTLPPFSLPDFTLDTIGRITQGAVAVAMLGLAEAVSIARAVAGRSHQRIDNNQEFIGQGLSNIVGSFFSAYAASGSFTRTGVNYDAGARTPLAAVFAAVVLAGILLLIAPLTAYLPIPAMAGVILLVAYNLVDFKQIRRIVRTSTPESFVLLVTFLATLFTELEFAIFAGVLLSLLLYLNRTSHPHFMALTPDTRNPRRSLVPAAETGLAECPQLKIIRLDGSIYFGAINHISEELHRVIEESPEQCHILIVGSGINFVDVTGCEMLFHEGHSLYLGGRRIYLSSLKPEVTELLERGGCVRRLGPDSVFCCKEEAIRHIVPRLDPERCRVCDKRVFLECKDMPGPESPGPHG